MENIFYVIQFIFIEHYNKPGTELLGTQRWIRSSSKALTGEWGGGHIHEQQVERAWFLMTWVGRRRLGRASAEVTFELDLEIWDFFVCLFPLSIGIRKKNSHKSTGHESVQGNPVPGVASAALEGSSSYSQSCWLRWRGEQERVGDSQRNFVKHLFYVIFHFIKCLYGFISLHLPLVPRDNICTLQTAMWKFLLLGKQVSFSFFKP